MMVLRDADRGVNPELTRRQRAMDQLGQGVVGAFGAYDDAQNTKRAEALQVQKYTQELKSQGYDVNEDMVKQSISGGPSNFAKLFGDKEPEKVDLYGKRTKEWEDKQASDQADKKFNRDGDLLDRKYKQEQINDMVFKRNQLGKSQAQPGGSPQAQGPVVPSVAELNGEAKNKVGSIASGFKALSSMKNAIKDGYGPSRIDSETPLLGTFVSDDPFTENRRIMSEVVGRLQSGGVIGKEELNTFNNMGPRPGDDSATIERKIAQQEAFLSNKLSAYGITQEQLSPMGFDTAPSYVAKEKSGVSNTANAGEIKKQLTGKSRAEKEALAKELGITP